MIARILLGAALGLSVSGAALAQSYTAPAGIPAVTAPGGTEGRAALPNIVDAQGGTLQGYGPRDTLTTGSVRRVPADHLRYGR